MLRINPILFRMHAAAYAAKMAGRTLYATSPRQPPSPDSVERLAKAEKKRERKNRQRLKLNQVKPV
jgi:hypothetical protein